MTCIHPDRPNVLSLPSMGNPHCCRECWDANNMDTRLAALPHHRDAWEKASDWHHSGGSYWYDSTRGRVLVSGKMDFWK